MWQTTYVRHRVAFIPEQAYFTKSLYAYVVLFSEILFSVYSFFANSSYALAGCCLIVLCTSAAFYLIFAERVIFCWVRCILRCVAIRYEMCQKPDWLAVNRMKSVKRGSSRFANNQQQLAGNTSYILLIHSSYARCTLGRSLCRIFSAVDCCSCNKKTTCRSGRSLLY